LLGTLLAALFVRALVPEGFMPAQGELVELCTMHGQRMVMVDPLTGEFVDADEDGSAPPCPFSLILTALAAPSAPALLLGTTPVAVPVAAPALMPDGRASLALPQARAPPRPDLA
jgi:hypothetical protein